MNANPSRWPFGARALALLLVVLLPVSAVADEAKGRSPVLAEMLELAWRLHPQAAGLDQRDAEALAAQERASSLTPEPGSVSLGQIDDRQGRNRGKQEWELELALPLWLPGQQEARLAEAGSRRSEVAARRAAIRLEVAGEVRDAWWTLALARATQALALRRMETARALDAAVQQRFKAGDVSRIDGNLAQGERLAAELDHLDAQMALQQAEQAFRLLTGREAPATVTAEVSERVGEGASTTASALTDLHPQLALAAATAGSAQARVRLADEFRRAAPELALRLVRSRDAFSEPHARSVGIQLKIPFSSAPQVRRDRSAAQAEAEQADAALRRAELRVQGEIERARRSVTVAEQQLAMAQERRVLFADNLRLAEKAFTLGEADLATLLRIRAAAFEAEAADERQRIARALAISRLNQALGVLP